MKTEYVWSNEAVKFVIFSCGYNCKDYVARHVSSIASQTYKYYTHIMVDDASTDGTYDQIIPLCIDYVSNYLFRNETNQKWIANAQQYLDTWATEDDVIVIVDMDDWLIRPDALELVAKAYRDPKTWMTYSRFMYDSHKGSSHWIPIYSPDVTAKRLFRGYIWSWTHLRTFKKHLYDKIDKEDLKAPDGTWPTSAYDRFIGMPMLEMASRGHIKFIPEVLYGYNDENPLQVEKINREKQEMLAKYVSGKKKYNAL